MNCFALNPLHLPSLNILWHSSIMNKLNYEWRDPYVLRRKMIHTSGEFDGKFVSEIAFTHAQCVFIYMLKLKCACTKVQQIRANSLGIHPM